MTAYSAAATVWWWPTTIPVHLLSFLLLLVYRRCSSTSISLKNKLFVLSPSPCSVGAQSMYSDLRIWTSPAASGWAFLLWDTYGHMLCWFHSRTGLHISPTRQLHGLLEHLGTEGNLAIWWRRSNWRSDCGRSSTRGTKAVRAVVAMAAMIIQWNRAMEKWLLPIKETFYICSCPLIRSPHPLKENKDKTKKEHITWARGYGVFIQPGRV